MGNTYALIPIGTFVILAYAVSFISSRLEILSVRNHRRIWNVLLLITFLVTGILGILLVLQVNYKLTLPAYDLIMQLHVDFGIGMFFISVFHFSWHLKYFAGMFKGKGKADEKEKTVITATATDNATKHYFTLFLLGFISISFQIVILREMVAVFNGNELVLGVVLFNWMLLTATGAYMGKNISQRFDPKSFLSRIILILSLLPILLTFLIYLLKNHIFIPGVEIGLWQVWWSSLVLLLPFCLISGMTFPIVVSNLSFSQDKNLTGKGYAVESFGSIIGGGIVSFVLVFFMDSFQILLTTFVITQLISIIISFKTVKSIFWISRTSIIILLVLLVYPFHIDNLAKQLLYINQELLYSKDTPHGNMLVTQQYGQVNFYQNHMLIANSNNVIENEEATHYGMLQHPSPENILMISGWFPDQVKEVLKYNPQHIDFVDLDKSILKFKRIMTFGIESGRVSFISQDPRVFVQRCQSMYDVVLINLPVPSTVQLNRFFTLEFYSTLKHAMKAGGVVSIAFTPSMNYLNEEIVAMNSSVYKALSAIFKNVQIIPGERDYYIASDAPLSLKVAEKADEEGFETEYVNSYYLDDQLIEQRSNAVKSTIDTANAVNRDFYPIVYGNQFRQWLAKSGINYKPVLIILLIIIAVFLFFLKPLYLGMFTSGFAAASYELIIIIAFQIVYGYLYLATGIIITLFMAGMTMGALMVSKRNFKKHKHAIVLLQAGIGFFGIVLPVIVKFTNQHPGLLSVQLLYYVLTLFASILVGGMFSLTSQFSKKSYLTTASNIYSIDLLGSALGALLASAFLIPALGVFPVSYLVGGMCLVGAGVGMLKMKNE
ncbi:MAG: hypothetical protein JXB49_19855 [Bacteroidales bacterium]|nr:hypothetical protein [Bacteroidales bacterium]